MPVMTILSLSGLCAVTMHLPATRHTLDHCISSQVRLGGRWPWQRHETYIATASQLACSKVSVTTPRHGGNAQRTGLNRRGATFDQGGTNLPARRADGCGLLKASGACGNALCSLHWPSGLARRLAAPGIIGVFFSAANCSLSSYTARKGARRRNE